MIFYFHRGSNSPPTRFDPLSTFSIFLYPFFGITSVSVSASTTPVPEPTILTISPLTKVSQAAYNQRHNETDEINVTNTRDQPNTPLTSCTHTQPAKKTSSQLATTTLPLPQTFHTLVPHTRHTRANKHTNKNARMWNPFTWLPTYPVWFWLLYTKLRV